MVTAEVDPGEAGRYGVVQVDGTQVRRYDYKPDHPRGGTVTVPRNRVNKKKGSWKCLDP